MKKDPDSARLPTVKELIDRIMLDAEHIIRGRLTGFLDTESKVSRN